MNRLLPVLGVVALGAMTWFILSRPADPSADRVAPATHPRTLASTAPQSLPPLTLEPEAPPSAPTTLEAVQLQGVVGQAATWLPTLMATQPEWKPVEGRPNAWKTDRMEIRWKVDQIGQVRGAEVVLVSGAFGGELTALSSFFVGNQEALPITLETSDPEEAARAVEGSFETQSKITYYYRAEYRSLGDPPFGPERFEISRDPFK